ncbi:MAG: peptide/nickel transport system ATP-binding protein [Glaciecola sp.]|jgi:peptide/nickel transport system ATP-binding protein
MTEPREHAQENGIPTLRIHDLSIEFARRRGDDLRVVEQVSLDIWPNEIVGVIGESGSGKTLTSLATLRMLPKRARITSGTIHLDDTSLHDRSEKDMRALRGDRIALIPQDAMQSLNPTLRIGRQVGEPLELHSGFSMTRAREAARALLDSVYIREPEKRVHEYPHQFSGGMQQRAMIAMGLALNPQLIIADEPTTALDVTVQAQVLKLLREIRDQKGTSILFITHDLGVVAELCDWVYVMRDGRIVENGPVRRIFTAPQTDYTRMLLEATPSIHTSPKRAR